MTTEPIIKETVNLESLQTFAATMAYLDLLQGITGKRLHGADSGIYTRMNLGHSPFIRYVDDERAFEPWDNRVIVDCSDFFMYACADAESIASLEDYYLFRTAANLFLTEYTEGKYTDLDDDEDAWTLYFTEQQDSELEYWLGRTYCILKWKSLPLPYWVEKMPEWLLKALDSYAEANGFSLQKNNGSW